MFGIKKAITCVALAMMSMAPIAAAEDMVAMLLPENVNPRWESQDAAFFVKHMNCLLYTSPSPRDLSTSRMPSSA